MPKTLLLADDSVVIQKLVGLSFANEDVTLVTADNGDDAIARARETRPDAVIADVIMPGKSGYEVCESLKRDPQLAHIPVLLLTGTFEAFDEERSTAVGAAGHITKPFEAQALVGRVKALFASAAAAKPTPSAAAPAATPEADSLDLDDAFDFFDDDVSDLSRTAPDVVATPSPSPTKRTTTADTDPLADPFFGEADASLGGLPGADDLDAGLLGSDSTVALMPDDEDGSDSHFSTDLVELGSVREAAATSRGAVTTLLDTEIESDAFSGSELPRTSAPAAWSAGGAGAETVIADFGDADDAFAQSRDSRSGVESMSALDVSDEFEIGSAREERPVDPSRTLLADDLFSTSPASGTVDLDAALEDDVDLMGEPSAHVTLDPGSSAYDLSSSDLGDIDVRDASFAADVDPLSDVPEVPDAPSPLFAPEPEPEAVLAYAERSDASVAPAGNLDLTPALRARLHETLEKVAWEAFSELSEQVVKQVMERVEAIAWEVIPQMTEALVRDEIRRMKGESDD